MRKRVLAIAVLLSSQVALADSDAFPDYAFQEPLVADPGVDTAKVTDKPAWCDAAGSIDEKWDGGRISRTVDQKYGIKGTIEGALHICQNTADPSWRKYAQRILQKWMNWTHQTQPDAERSLRARIQFAKWDKQHDELCQAIDVSPEAAAEVKTFGDARRQLFGCTNENQALWQDRTGANAGGVEYYLDSDLQTDPLMRVYWLYEYLPSPDKPLPAKTGYDNLPLMFYAVAAPDVAKLDRGALDKMMQAAPYNEYARVVLNETISDLMGKVKVLDTAVDKLSKGDDDYTTILRKAPQQAYADWDKLVAQWKPELERSEAFEKLWSAASRKAMKGCSPALLKDAEKVVKQYKGSTYHDMIDKLEADPIGNLLFARLAVCLAFDGVQNAGPINEIVQRSRHVRGPRTLAYFAIVEAYALAKKDRPRMVLQNESFTNWGGENNFDEKAFDYHGFLAPEWTGDSVTQGVVGTAKKTPEGTKITFKKVTFKYQNYECQDTNKPKAIDEQGRIIYYQVCHNLPGMTTVDRTPEPVMIQSLLDGVAKPGTFLAVEELGADRAKTGEWIAVPMYTKKTANDKTILSFYGIAAQ